MTDLADLAVAFWRLSAWVDNVNAERKAAATSALRQMRQYLSENGIEIRDCLGERYDPGLAFDVVGVLSGEELPEEELVVAETLVPLVLRHGEVLRYGQVMLGKAPREAAANGALPPTPERAIPSLVAAIGQYRRASYRDKKISRKLNWCGIKLEKQLRAIRKGASST